MILSQCIIILTRIFVFNYDSLLYIVNLSTYLVNLCFVEKMKYSRIEFGYTQCLCCYEILTHIHGGPKNGQPVWTKFDKLSDTRSNFQGVN